MKYNKNIKTIFFDLDHTLWDFDKNSSLTFKHIFKGYDFEFSYLEFLKHFMPINHLYWKAFSENKINKEELRVIRLQKTFKKLNYNYNNKIINEISNEYIKTLPTKTFLLDGALDLLNNIKSYYDLNIITNGFDDVQFQKMKFSGLLDFFNKIITPEKAGAKKPDAKIFNYALKLTNKAPENCLMIGDDFSADILGALNVGIKAIHYNSNNEAFHNDCPIVNSHKDLNKLLI